MNDNSYKIFFSLVRIAMKRQNSLAYIPSKAEWYEVFKVANMQAMLGVCFYGIQLLPKSESINIKNDRLFFTWVGLVAQIQQRNHILNERCQSIIGKLKSEGFKCCILKGQGVAHQYKEELQTLRQSGDIDVWIDADFKTLMKWAVAAGKIKEIGDHHINLCSDDTIEYEYHYTPCTLHHYWNNIKMQKWIKSVSNEQFVKKIETNDGFIFFAPTINFNLVFLMAHMHRHFFGEGLGLRQIIDYYYVLCKSSGKEQVEKKLNDFGLLNFSQGIMWILQEKFHLENRYLVCKPNEKLGRFILEEIMEGGNFGHYDTTRKLTNNASHMYRFFEKIKVGRRYLNYFPSEFLWTPISYAREFLLSHKYR